MTSSQKDTAKTPLAELLEEQANANPVLKFPYPLSDQPRHDFMVEKRAIPIFFQAIKKNDFSWLETWLSETDDPEVVTQQLVNQVYARGELTITPLSYAVKHGKPEMITWLLTHGADMHQPCKMEAGSCKEITPFLYALSMGDIEKIACFIQHDPGIIYRFYDIKNHGVRTALYQAIRHSSQPEALVHYILQKHHENKRHPHWQPEWQWQLRPSQDSLISDTQFSCGNPLLWAVITEQENTVRLLLAEVKQDPQAAKWLNAPAMEGTPLYWAVVNSRNPNITKLLLAADANMYLRDTQATGSSFLRLVYNFFAYFLSQLNGRFFHHMQPIVFLLFRFWIVQLALKLIVIRISFSFLLFKHVNQILNNIENGFCLCIQNLWHYVKTEWNLGAFTYAVLAICFKRPGSEKEVAFSILQLLIDNQVSYGMLPCLSAILSGDFKVSALVLRHVDPLVVGVEVMGLMGLAVLHSAILGTGVSIALPMAAFGVALIMTGITGAYRMPVWRTAVARHRMPYRDILGGGAGGAFYESEKAEPR